LGEALLIDEQKQVKQNRPTHMRRAIFYTYTDLTGFIMKHINRNDCDETNHD